MDAIKNLYDVRPGDMYLGNIGGAVGVGVALARSSSATASGSASSPRATSAS
jgi:hypothetical protein